MYVCDDISVCRRRVCMCLIIFQCGGGDVWCDDISVCVCVCLIVDKPESCGQFGGINMMWLVYCAV